MAKQYPAIRQTISRSAQHMAEANDLLEEIAACGCTKLFTR